MKKAEVSWKNKNQTELEQSAKPFKIFKNTDRKNLFEKAKYLKKQKLLKHQKS